MTHIKLTTKKRMAITVRFFLRQPAKDADGNKRPLSNPHPIQCRVTVDGIIDAGFSTGVRVDPAIWDQKGQKATGRSDHAQRVTRQLIQIRTKLEQIHDWQYDRYDKKQGPKPTPKTIRHEFDTGKKPVADSTGTPQQGITLISAFQSYVTQMEDQQKTPLGRTDSTITLYKQNLALLKDYLSNRPGLLAEDVTIGWAKNYYAWLLKQPAGKNKKGTRSLSTARRIVKRISSILDYLNEFQVLPNGNQVARMKLQKSPDKEVYFLDPAQIDRLFALTTDDPAEAVVLWWSRLMVITGLDYPDAVRYAQDRAAYTYKTPYGEKVIIDRAKTCVTSEIPLTGEVLVLLNALFDQYPTGARVYCKVHVNNRIDNVAVKIGFTLPLSIKIFRKTAGAWMLWRGFRLEAVSKALGHSNITTTQRYYVKITGTLIDLEMKRMYESGGGAYMAA